MTKKRRERVGLSLTKEEYKKLEKSALKKGYTISEYIKIISLQGDDFIKPKRQYKNNQNKVLVSFSDDEIKKLDIFVRENSSWRATISRKIILETLEKGVFVPQSVQNDLERIEYLITKISDNINQMAHYSNSIKQAIDDRVVGDQLDKLEDDIYEFIQFRLKADRNDN